MREFDLNKSANEGTHGISTLCYLAGLKPLGWKARCPGLLRTMFSRQAKTVVIFLEHPGSTYHRFMQCFPARVKARERKH